MRDPEQVLATLTRRNATFSERDPDRYLAKHIADDAERAATRAAIFARAETLGLYDRVSREAAGRYTTRTVQAQERAPLVEAVTACKRATSARDMGLDDPCSQPAHREGTDEPLRDPGARSSPSARAWQPYGTNRRSNIAAFGRCRVLGTYRR
jgi:hypothetical protein